MIASENDINECPEGFDYFQCLNTENGCLNDECSNFKYKDSCLNINLFKLKMEIIKLQNRKVKGGGWR